MRRLLTGAAMVASVAVLGVTTTHAASIDRREHRQIGRIAHGVGSGALTRRGAARLLAEQAHIRAREFVYRRTGGELTRWERRDLHRRLNRAGRHIWIQAHDGQRRR
jgi:hypothetical protein